MSVPRKGRLAVATLGVAVVAALGAAPAQATFPGQNGEIAFTRDGSLYAASGMSGHLLATPSQWPYIGAAGYSADGSSVVYAECCGIGHGSLWFVGADGANPHAAGLEGTDPAFSPDGARIAFHTRVGDAPGLVTTQLDGSDRIALGDFDEPDWSPDGATIAASASHDDIWAVPAGGGEPQQLTSGPAADDQPSWSPDGTLVAFTRDSSIAVTDAAGSEPIVLTTGYAPVWSPDGTTIAFTRLVDGEPQVWAIGADGSGERPLIRDAGVVAWQPAGEALPLPEPLPDPGPAPGPPEPPTGNHKPRCSSVKQSVKRLPWRPDHRLYPVRLAGGRDPDGDRVRLRVTWISQDERMTGRGDHTAPDARRTHSNRVVLLRNERARHGDGRVYYVEFRLTDRWGRHCTGARYVRVRRWKHRPAVAQKARFPSVRG